MTPEPLTREQVEEFCRILNLGDNEGYRQKVLDFVSENGHRIISTLQSLARRWVAVSERLPSDGVSVLIWNGYIIKTRKYGSDWLLPSKRASDAVTHWMPLPAPPAEQDAAPQASEQSTKGEGEAALPSPTPASAAPDAEYFNVTCAQCGRNWRGSKDDLRKPIADCERMDCGLRSFRRWAVTQPAPDAGLVERLTKALFLLRRYRTETPLGHQPHMIAHEVDKFLEAGDGLRGREG